jgi:DNA polymerase-3 subunit gamma/tau
MADLILEYRPTTWEEVLGQSSVVSSLRSLIKSSGRRSIILTGPSGVGKTTIARILASKVRCESSNLLEIDAATHTGIDAMRMIAEQAPYKGFGESAVKVIIVDEAHALSKQAWQSLLKVVEEPPEHVWWIFCTTEPNKIPKTIETRCACFELKPVHVDEIQSLLLKVVCQEGYDTPEEVIITLARHSFGSPRRALVLLNQCYGCKTTKSALAILQKADEEGDAIVLARAIVKGGLNWSKLMKLLQPLRDQNPESIRIVTLAYLTTVAFGSKSDDQAGRCLELLDCFSESYNSSEGFAPLLLSLGRVIFR